MNLIPLLSAEEREREREGDWGIWKIRKINFQKNSEVGKKNRGGSNPGIYIDDKNEAELPSIIFWWGNSLQF